MRSQAVSPSSVTCILAAEFFNRQTGNRFLKRPGFVAQILHLTTGRRAGLVGCNALATIDLKFMIRM